MNISDLHVGRLASVRGVVSVKGQPRVFSKFGKQGRVCDAILKDATGEVSIVLWDDHIDLICQGDTVCVYGLVKEWKNTKQLSVREIDEE